MGTLNPSGFPPAERNGVWRRKELIHCSKTSTLAQHKVGGNPPRGFSEGGPRYRLAPCKWIKPRSLEEVFLLSLERGPAVALVRLRSSTGRAAGQRCPDAAVPRSVPAAGPCPGSAVAVSIASPAFPARGA